MEGDLLRETEGEENADYTEDVKAIGKRRYIEKRNQEDLIYSMHDKM